MSKKIAEFTDVLNVTDATNVDKELSMSTFVGTENNKRKQTEMFFADFSHKMGKNAIIQGNYGKKCTKKGNCICVFDCNELRKFIKENNVNVLTLTKGQELFFREEKIQLNEDIDVRILKEQKTEKNPDPEIGIVPIKEYKGTWKWIFLNPLLFPMGIKIKIS